MTRNRHRRYRFALYGRSGSGKTCMLATLAQGAIGHPGGLTCERLPVVAAKPNENASTVDQAARESKGLHAGRKWIDEAIAALQKFEVPQANPPFFDGTPMIIDFRMGDPKRGAFDVRTFDYSGELINPADEHRVNAMANSLKRCLGEYDGFLIVAETPRRGEDCPQLTEELRLLREAFSSLREQDENLWETPVAVVFSKWDRFSQLIDYNHPGAERKKLQEFLNTHRAHKALVDAIENALASPSEVQGGNLAGETPTPDNPNGTCFDNRLTNGLVYTASSFGRAVRRENREQPAPGDHPPFGLLDPLIALANARDLLDKQRLVEEYARRRSVLNKLPWRLRRYRKMANRAKNLLVRMPKNSPAAADVKQVKTKANSVYTSFCLFWLALAVLLAETAYDGIRRLQFDAYVAQARNPQTPTTKLAEARTWFDQYRRRWNGLFFAPAASGAAGQLEALDEAIHTRFWEAVENESNLFVKAEKAKKYLEILPNGRRAADCEKIINQAIQQKNDDENTTYLATIGQKAEAARKGDDYRKAFELVQMGFPHPALASQEQRKTHRQTRDFLQGEIEKDVARKDWAKFTTAYEHALSQNALGLAANLLVGREPKDVRWRKMAEGFTGQVDSKIRTRVARELQDRWFDGAEEALQQALNALKHLENSVRPIDQDLAEALLQGQRQFKPIEREIHTNKDKFLYEKVRKTPGADVCRQYVDGAPLKVMEPHVKAYADYLEARRQKMNLKLSAKIYWDKAYDYDEDDHILTVTLNDRQRAPIESLHSTPGKLSGEVGLFQLTQVRLADVLKVHASLIEKDTILGLFDADDDSGSGTKRFKISDLERGQTVRLTPADDSAFINELRLKIVDGLPQKPDLPAWNNPSSLH